MVQVSATCPSCSREIQETAPPGRITWQGPCPGCGRKVTARRVKTAAKATTPPPAPEPRTRKIKYVDDYSEPGHDHRHPAEPDDDSAPAEPTGGSPAGDEGTGAGVIAEPPRIETTPGGSDLDGATAEPDWVVPGVF